MTFQLLNQTQTATRFTATTNLTASGLSIPAGQWITLEKKRLWRQTLWTCASQTAGFLVWASTHVLSMFSGSEKGVISLSHFLKCFQVSSCRDKSRARSLKTTEEGKTLSGVQECMLSVFKNKPKLDQRRGLNLAGIMSSFTFSDRQRGLWGLCWL